MVNKQIPKFPKSIEGSGSALEKYNEVMGDLNFNPSLQIAVVIQVLKKFSLWFTNIQIEIRTANTCNDLLQIY